MLKCTYLAFVIFAASWTVDPLRKRICQNHKLGHNDGRQVWNGAASGQYWCRHNPLAFGGDDEGSDEVDSDDMLLLVATSVDGNSSTWVTPTMGTQGGTTIINEVVTGVVAK